jgi:hypothetical protein
MDRNYPMNVEILVFLFSNNSGENNFGFGKNRIFQD